MCNGYPTFAKRDDGKKAQKCCDHIMHVLQPMRDENPHDMVIISKEEKLQNQYKNLHEQAQRIINRGIEASMKTKFGPTNGDPEEMKK